MRSADIDQFLVEVAGEVTRATEKFPLPEANLCALTEEVGELARALMEEPSSAVRAEAVQVASMAARVALEGDPSLDRLRARRGADKHPSTPPKDRTASPEVERRALMAVARFAAELCAANEEARGSRPADDIFGDLAHAIDKAKALSDPALW